jgi:hypothetical protein
MRAVRIAKRKKGKANATGTKGVKQVTVIMADADFLPASS